MTLCVFAIVIVGFAPVLYAHTSHHSADVSVSAGVAGKDVCEAAGGGGGPDNPAKACCDGCILAVSAALPAGRAGRFVFRPEISTRFIFASRLGRELDHRPQNLRSRAPPVIA